MILATVACRLLVVRVIWLRLPAVVEERSGASEVVVMSVDGEAVEVVLDFVLALSVRSKGLLDVCVVVAVGVVSDIIVVVGFVVDGGIVGRVVVGDRMEGVGSVENCLVVLDVAGVEDEGDAVVIVSVVVSVSNGMLDVVGGLAAETADVDFTEFVVRVDDGGVVDVGETGIVDVVDVVDKLNSACTVDVSKVVDSVSVEATVDALVDGLVNAVCVAVIVGVVDVVEVDGGDEVEIVVDTLGVVEDVFIVDVFVVDVVGAIDTLDVVRVISPVAVVEMADVVEAMGTGDASVEREVIRVCVATDEVCESDVECCTVVVSGI